MTSTYLHLKSSHLQLLLILFLMSLQNHNAQTQFANGADIGWLSQMEDNGYIFKNNSDVQKNCLEILKEKGINALRFRVWVNPSSKYCSKRDVAYMAQRAKSMGFYVMIDFHMSDDWADPSKQTKPAAWATHSFTQLQTDVYNHVYSILDTLKSIGVTPKWVQIGNETNDGMLWEDGRASTHMKNFADLIRSGYNAVKAVDNTVQVVVHLSKGYDYAMYRWMFDGLKNNSATWDIIGMSVYPYWDNKTWQVDNSMALITMIDMINRYNTKVMVCEAGYPYNHPDEAKNYLADLIAKTKSVGGLGVFYWEPECYNWQNYQLGAWDPVTKQPTIAMDAFLEASPVSEKENKITTDYNLSQNYPNPFNPSTVINYQLPVSSHITLKVYDILGREAAALVDQFMNAGSYNFQFSILNSQLSSGVYFYILNAGTFSQSRKMILLK
jgi:arabinogalactan endo-1,4-beta-galactosidase